MVVRVDVYYGFGIYTNVLIVPRFLLFTGITTHLYVKLVKQDYPLYLLYYQTFKVTQE